MKNIRFVPLFLLVLCIIENVFSAVLRKGPYLVYPGTNTAMLVLWQTDDVPSTPARIYYGYTTSYEKGYLTVNENSYNENEHIFISTLSALTPGSKIYYKVSFDTITVESFFFSAPSDNADSLTFYAFGDTRSQPDKYSSVLSQILYDINRSSDISQTFILHSGDWVASGDNESDWDDQLFNRSYNSILEIYSKVPVMGARGNHEGTGQLFKKYFKYPYSDINVFYYSFDYGPVHITVIDNYTDFSPGTTQYNWIKNDLSKTEKKWKIILFHQPGYSTGNHGNDINVQSYLCPLFIENNVFFTVAGHNHCYSRCYVRGVNHITTGGGGAPLHSVNISDPYIVRAESAYHFLKFEIKSETVNVTAIRDDGSILENFTVYYDTSVFNAPSVSITPVILDFGEVGAGEIKTMTFKIENTGSGILSGIISSRSDWIFVSPTSFEGNEIEVRVTVDNSVLNKKEGEYTGEVKVQTNGGEITLTVKLTATCIIVSPNPYNPSKGDLKFSGDVIVPRETTLKIYTLMGELIKSFKNAGNDKREIIWNGRTNKGSKITSGIYIFTYENSKEKGVGKFTVINHE